MNAPTYSWVCHLCKQTNLPGIEACTHCGFSAVASAKDIEAASQKSLNPTAAQKAACYVLVAVATPVAAVFKFGAFNSAVWFVPLFAIGLLLAFAKRIIENGNDR